MRININLIKVAMNGDQSSHTDTSRHHLDLSQRLPVTNEAYPND